MPSVQWGVRAVFSSDQVVVVGINNTSSASWLRSYRGQKALSFPLVYDQANQLFQLYQVGNSYGNIPPSYFILDKKGIVRYRTDNVFKHTEEMIAKINELLVERIDVVN